MMMNDNGNVYVNQIFTGYTIEQQFILCLPLGCDTHFGIYGQ